MGAARSAETDARSAPDKPWYEDAGDWLTGAGKDAHNATSGYASELSFGFINLGGDKDSGLYKGGQGASYVPWNPVSAAKSLGTGALKLGAKALGKDAAQEGAETVVKKNADELTGWAGNAGSRSQASRELGKSLENAPGRGPRPPGHEAHHLVASHDPRAARAQEILQRLGVHPNQAENGAWLPGPKAKGADPPPVGTPHRPIHTDAYYDDVVDRLSEANSKEKALEILEDLGQQVERGDYP